MKTTISQLSNTKDEESQLGEDINYCINKYNLWSDSSSSNPDDLAKLYDENLQLAKCLREKGINGYDVKDPKNEEGLRSVLTPIFLAANEKGRTELFETIQACAEENNIPLGDNADFENPEDVADRLDTELEFAQCLREKGIEVEDPSADRPLRPILVGLVQSGQYLEDQIREAAAECFDDLGLEPPEQGGG